MILVQLIMGIVFWDRHWSKTTETMAEQIAGNYFIYYHNIYETS